MNYHAYVTEKTAVTLTHQQRERLINKLDKENWEDCCIGKQLAFDTETYNMFRDIVKMMEVY